MGTKQDSAQRSLLQRVVDLAIGGGAAVLGCSLLAATAVHLIASAGSVREARVSLAAPLTASVVVPVPVVRPLPHVAAKHRAALNIARSHVAIRRQIVQSPVRVPSKSYVASAIVARKKHAPIFYRARQLATVRRPVPSRPHPERPRVLRVVLQGDAFVGSPPRRTSAAPRLKKPARYEVLPPLIGVAGVVAAMPRLEGTRMRGRVVVPTPAPSASVVPFSRTGLSPGP